MIVLSVTSGTPSPLEPTSDGLAGPVDVFGYPLWMVVLAAVAAAIVLGALIAALVIRLKRRPPPLPPSARAIALRELEKLRAQVQTLEPYAFSIAVSDVLRGYIGAEYRLHAAQQTSPEFLASISGSMKFSDSDRRLLSEFLDRCDLIKFARIEADASDSARLLESAVAFAQGVSA